MICRTNVGGGNSIEAYCWEKYNVVRNKIISINPTFSIAVASSTKVFHIQTPSWDVNSLLSSLGITDGIYDKETLEYYKLRLFFEGFTLNTSTPLIFKYGGMTAFPDSLCICSSNTSGKQVLNFIVSNGLLSFEVNSAGLISSSAIGSFIGEKIVVEPVYTFEGYVTSKDSSKYPHKETVGDFYYEKVELENVNGTILTGTSLGEIEKGSWCSRKSFYYNKNASYSAVGTSAYSVDFSGSYADFGKYRVLACIGTSTVSSTYSGRLYVYDRSNPSFQPSTYYSLSTASASVHIRAISDTEGIIFAFGGTSYAGTIWVWKFSINDQGEITLGERKSLSNSSTIRETAGISHVIPMGGYKFAILYISNNYFKYLIIDYTNEIQVVTADTSLESESYLDRLTLVQEGNDYYALGTGSKSSSYYSYYKKVIIDATNNTLSLEDISCNFDAQGVYAGYCAVTENAIYVRAYGGSTYKYKSVTDLTPTVLMASSIYYNFVVFDFSDVLGFDLLATYAEGSTTIINVYETDTMSLLFTLTGIPETNLKDNELYIRPNKSYGDLVKNSMVLYTDELYPHAQRITKLSFSNQNVIQKDPKGNMFSLAHSTNGSSILCSKQV